MQKIPIDSHIQQKLLKSQYHLTNYLKLIRHKQLVPKIQFTSLPFIQPLRSPKTKKTKVPKKQANQIKPYIRRYFSLLHQVLGLQNCISNKIIKKTLQFFELIPSISFLIETINSYGKQKKNICMNETAISVLVTDDMIPLFEKIIQKIQSLIRQSESKKLIELGHRIYHLQIQIDTTKQKVKKNDENHKIFRTFECDRIQKYLLMEDNINNAEKNYGKFSQNLSKKREIFSNINKIYLQIKNSSYED